MKKISAGILLFKNERDEKMVYLVHPGGPYNSKKDDGLWSIPKGEQNSNEELIDAAIREVEEEIGVKIIDKNSLEYIGEIKQKSGKLVHCWSHEYKGGEIKVNSNKVNIEFPYKSGQFIEIPEVDRGEWFSIEDARVKINEAQIEFLKILSVTHCA